MTREEACEYVRNQSPKGLPEKAAKGKVLPGTSLVQVGEKGRWEYALLPPGSVVAPPASQKEKPTMASGLQAILGQIFEAVPAGGKPKGAADGAVASPERQREWQRGPLRDWLGRQAQTPGRPQAQTDWIGQQLGRGGGASQAANPVRPRSASLDRTSTSTPLRLGQRLTRPLGTTAVARPSVANMRLSQIQQRMAATRQAMGLQPRQSLQQRFPAFFMNLPRAQGGAMVGRGLWPGARRQRAPQNTPAGEGQAAGTTEPEAPTLPIEFMQLPFLQDLMQGRGGSILQRMVGTAQPFGPSQSMPNWQGMNYYDYLKDPQHEQLMTQAIASAFGMPPEQAVEQMRRATMVTLGAPLQTDFTPRMR